MYYIVGLGNPGEEYAKTRHNVGRAVVERLREHNDLPEWKHDKKTKALVSKGTFGEDATTLVLPETFMNKSGGAVSSFIKSKKAAEKLLVVHDDLDLPIGTMKVAFDRGAAGHKGVESVIRALGTKAFIRIRIGISPARGDGIAKKPKGEKAVHDFVLKAFTPGEQLKIKGTIIRAETAAHTILSLGKERAMNEFN